ncbi:MAG: hypothetical protein K2X87_10050 [Gemmataceae bacterium]|nr:hypothetical protein [Gemmataceae bacterium]
MTPTDAVRELFAEPRDPAVGLRPLAEGLLSIAGTLGSVELPLPTRRFGRLWSRLVRPGADLGGLSRRLFRPLLAYIAGLAAEECRAEFDPYHGRYTLERPGPDGPGRLDVLITNTPGDQRLRIARIPLPAPAPDRSAAAPAG